MDAPETPTLPDPARRRLVRLGLWSAPAVLTLTALVGRSEAQSTVGVNVAVEATTRVSIRLAVVAVVTVNITQ